MKLASAYSAVIIIGLFLECQVGGQNSTSVPGGTVGNSELPLTNGSVSLNLTPSWAATSDPTTQSSMIVVANLTTSTVSNTSLTGNLSEAVTPNATISPSSTTITSQITISTTTTTTTTTTTASTTSPLSSPVTAAAQSSVSAGVQVFATRIPAKSFADGIAIISACCILVVFLILAFSCGVIYRRLSASSKLGDSTKITSGTNGTFYAGLAPMSAQALISSTSSQSFASSPSEVGLNTLGPNVSYSRGVEVENGRMPHNPSVNITGFSKHGPHSNV